MSDPIHVTIADQTGMRLAVKSPELADVPQSKIAAMVLRTVLGCLFLLFGLVLLAFMTIAPLVSAYKANDMKQISLVLVFTGLGAALFCAVLGATIWSSQLMKKPMTFVIESFKSVIDIIFRRGQAPTPPTGG